jgi:hypothetical protein
MCHSRSVVGLRAVLVLVLIGVASSLFGLANRVFVSARSGNNANSCDNVLTPCQTFAGAVAQLNPGGEAIVLDSGGYGAVTITKALTIEAPAGVTAFVHPSSGDAITISAGASDTVTLRGLVLNVGTGNGITVNTVGSLFVEDCSITGFSSYGVQMAGPGNLNMKNTSVKGSFVGVEIGNAFGAVIASLDHCHLDGNTAGFRAHTTSPGGSKTIATNTTANNNVELGWICGATGSGIDLLSLELCSGSSNGLEGALGNSANSSSALTLSNSVFNNNGGFGAKRASLAPLQTRTNNTMTGNVSGNIDGEPTPIPPQ